MKRRLTAFALSGLIASPALAGGLAEPVMTMAPPEIVAATPSSSSADIIIPLILIALIAAAASSSDAGGGGGIAISDERTKTDIVPVGVTANGIPLYQYRYIGSHTVFEGVMAQDVLQHTPSAVVTRASGLMAVNYDALGIALKVID